MKKGKMNSIRRRVGKALRYLAATVTSAIGFYILFALFFSTGEERRLRQENDLYADWYGTLREKERPSLTEVVELCSRYLSETVSHTAKAQEFLKSLYQL